jgi:hypothetical protein
MIRTIDPVDERESKKRGLPSYVLAQETHGKHYRRADHVERERPEVAFGPNLVRRLAFGHRNDDRNWNCVREEKNQGRDEQQRQRARPEHPLQIVISEVRQDDGVCHHAEDVENDLDRNQFLPRSEQALCQGRGAAKHQRLGKIQFEHAQQNKQEVDRHGAVDAGQLNFETGSENRDQQVAEKSAQVDTLPVP